MSAVGHCRFTAVSGRSARACRLQAWSGRETLFRDVSLASDEMSEMAVSCRLICVSEAIRPA